MAESEFVEAALGDSEAVSEAGRISPSADPVAVAVAMDQAKFDPELARQAAGYLEDQRALVRLQLKHFDEEQVLALGAARRKRYADRIRNGLATLAAVAVAAVLVILGIIVWDASQERGLVIDAFSVPPDLARDGLTGQVVANRFLDALQTLQASTESERPPASYRNDWGSAIKVEIPQTGLTFGDFDRLLRDRLGQQRHVTGEVFRTPTGFALTARLGDQPPQTFAGPQADLDTMARQAAEAIYRANQPYRYAQYLAQHGREAEAEAVDRALMANGPRGERAWAAASLAALSLARGDLAGARQAVQTGVAAGGDGVPWAEIQLAAVEAWSGHDEALLALSARADRGDFRKRSANVTAAAYEENRLVSSAFLAGLTGAYGQSAATYGDLAAYAHSGDTPAFYFALAAWALAANHDVDGAAAALAKSGPLDTAFYVEAAREGYNALPAYQLDVARGDWPAALARLRAIDALIEADKAAQPSLGLMQPVLVWPLQARALARTGDLAAASRLIATTPLDCYLCVRVRAEVAAAMNDWAAADRWYAEAVRQAPSLPFAYDEWGRTRLARRDYSAAIANFRTAYGLETRFADPIKYWGDVLAAQGLWAAARDKYDAALQLAPAWEDLRRARDLADRQVH